MHTIRICNRPSVFLACFAALVQLVLIKPANALFDAGLIDVDLESLSPRVYSGAAAIGQAGDIWNASPTFTLNPVALRFVDGAPSPVSLQTPIFQGPFGQYGIGGFSESSSPMAFGPYGALMSDGFGGILTSLPVVFTLNGLTPDARYEVFTYSYYAGLAATTIDAGGATGTVTNRIGLDSLIEGQTYARLSSATANSSGSLDISLRNANLGGLAPMSLNGFQIRPVTVVPEPGTLCVGILLFGWCVNARPIRRM